MGADQAAAAEVDVAAEAAVDVAAEAVSALFQIRAAPDPAAEEVATPTGS